MADTERRVLAGALLGAAAALASVLFFGAGSSSAAPAPSSLDRVASTASVATETPALPRIAVFAVAVEPAARP